MQPFEVWISDNHTGTNTSYVSILSLSGFIFRCVGLFVLLCIKPVIACVSAALFFTKINAVYANDLYVDIS